MQDEIAVRIETTADILLLRPLNLFLRGLLQQHSAFTGAEEWIDNLELAFNEAFTNIRDHAYHNRQQRPLTVLFGVSAQRLEIRFEDQGSAIDLSQVRQPNSGDPGDRGLGVWLIRQFLDEVIYETGPDGRNMLTLVKHLPPQRTDTGPDEMDR